MSKRILKLRAKCDDRCHVVVDAIEEEKMGYVPFNLGIGGGDYVELEIDLDTGRIVGWEVPSDEDIMEALSG